jgi:oligopeptide/dipeptide ABC transporter ATP-binding protein
MTTAPNPSRVADDARSGGEAELLEVEGLKVHYPSRGGWLPGKGTPIKAVDGVSFRIRPGRTLGLVGESGSGKSTTARAVLQLHRPTAGSVRFRGIELTTIKGEPLRRVRRHLQFVAQDPKSSLDPRMTIANIVAEPLLVHGQGSRADREAKVRELLDLVGLPRSVMSGHPRQFSGGQLQRVAIARSLALGPALIICDEPVSSLDVSIQAQIVNLLLDLQTSLSHSYLFIGHDLAVVRQVSDTIAVMYLGRIVELASRDALLADSLHPYTVALVSAVPPPDPVARKRARPVLALGEPADPAHPPAGCHYHPRCPIARDRCRTEDPPLQEAKPGQWVACHFPGELRSPLPIVEAGQGPSAAHELPAAPTVAGDGLKEGRTT